MTLLDRLAEPPSRVVGIALAALAAVLMLGGPLAPQWLLPAELLSGEITPSDDEQVTLIRVFLGANVVALLGFLPLLGAVHSVVGTTATRPALLLGAYLVLLVRPALILIDFIAAPLAPLAGGGLIVAYFLVATTGIAAGLASMAILPLARDAASPVRRWTLGAVIAVLVALALVAFAPYIAPLSALGIAAALVLRRGDKPNGVSRAGMNGPAGQS